MNISTMCLKNLSTISSLRVLIAFVEKSEGDFIVQYSINKIKDDTGISIGSIKKAIDELESKKIITIITNKNGFNEYRLSECIFEHNSFEQKVINGWKKAVGVDNKKPEPNLVIDFTTLNFYHPNINSITEENNNVHLTDKELGALAKQIMLKWFSPLSTEKNRDSKWFSYQMKLIKDLLVQWRTEQVLAGIEYWSTINPLPTGLSSLRFLTYKKYGRSKMMEALDYYKAEYLKNESEINKDKIIENKNKIKQEAEKRDRIKKEERQIVDDINDDEFVKSLLSGFGKIEIAR